MKKILFFALIFISINSFADWYWDGTHNNGMAYNWNGNVDGTGTVDEFGNPFDGGGNGGIVNGGEIKEVTIVCNTGGKGICWRIKKEWILGGCALSECEWDGHQTVVCY